MPSYECSIYAGFSGINEAMSMSPGCLKKNGGFIGQVITRDYLVSDDESITDSELDMPIDWIPGMKNIRLKDMPSFIRTTDLKETLFDFMGSLAKNCLTSSAIIVNTIQEFELEVLDAIKAKFPNIYNIGPAPLLTRHVPEDKHARSVRLESMYRDTSQGIMLLYFPGDRDYKVLS
ncbi:hypothetical protein JHK82_049076 [Glycine max]|nr:hypothetical protein JHK82_049076 [Glycine max]